MTITQCPQCHQDTTYRDGNPTHRHDPIYGYFGLTLCELARTGSEQLKEAQEVAYRHRLVWGGAA